ncbi:unnamed protein product [Schistocephalus solidus]|uniref:ANK_REP_REGION domain-containing protein n=1 Tax=Schistocephalus solidus TaxID=70667 RepID=A0A183T9Y7_SCHSO|nr:unnamed protein product [Schistocephalus solidus]
MHAPLRKISDQEKYVQQVQSQLSMNAEEVSRYLRDVEQERQRISTELADMERMQKNQEMQIRSLSQRMQQWRSTKHLMDRTVNEYLSAPTQDSVGSEAQTSEVTRDLIQGYPMTALPRLREIDRIGAVRPGDDESLPPQPPPPLRKPKLAEFDGQPSLHKSRSTTQFDFSARVREAPGPSLAVIRCQTQDSRSFVFQQSVVPRQAMVALGAKETRDINTFVGVVNQPANVQVDLDDLSQYEMVSCAARTTDSALKRSVSTSDLQTQIFPAIKNMLANVRSVSTSDLQTQILLVKNNSSTQYEPTRDGEGSLRWNKGDFSTTRPRLKSGNQEYFGQRPKTADVQAQICKNVRDRGSQVGVIVIPTEIDISRVELDNLGLEVQPSRESAALGLRVGTVLCPATIGQTMELHDGPGIEVLGFNDVNSMRVRHGNMLATAVSQPSRDVETQIMTVQKSSRSQCDSFEDSTTGSEGTPGRSSSSGDVQTQIGILKHTASVQAVAAMQVVEVPSFTAKKTIASGTVEATTKLTILPESITMTTEEQYERPAKSEEDMEEANDVMTQIGCLLHSRGLHTDLRTYLSEYASRIGTLQTTQVDLTTQIGLVKHEQYQTEMSQQANLSGRTADLQTQILPVVTEEGTQVARTGALKLTSISHGKTSAKTMGSTSASAPRGGDQVETMISRHFSDCSTQVSTKLIPTEISLSKIALSTTEVSFKKNQQLERLEVPADSIIYPGKIKYDTQLTEDGSSIEVTDVSEVSRFLVTNEDQVILANLKSTSGDAQTQIFTLDKERDLQGAMVLSSFSSDDNGLKPNVDLQTQIGRWVDNKVITKDSKEQTFPSYASGLCTQCKCKLQDLQTQVSALDVPEMLSSEEDTAPRRNADGTVSVGPIRKIESWTTKVGSKSTADNMNQIYSVNKNASVQVGVELTPTKIAMARCDTENTQIMATDRSELDSEQADCVASLDAILCPARMQVTTRLVDGASGFQLIPVSQTEMVTLSVDNAGLDPKFTSSAFATPRKSTEAVGTGLDVTLNDELDAYLVLGSQSKNPAVAKEKVLRRLLTKTVDSSTLRLVPIVGSFVSESGLRPSVPLTDTMCQIFKVVTDAQVQVGSRLVPQELSLSKVGMENLELNLKNRKSFTDIQIQIDSLLYPLEVKMSTELCEQAGITIARLDEVDQVSINTSSVADDTVVNGSDGLEAEVTRTSRVHQPQMSDLQTQILHADTRPTMGSVMVVDPGKASSASGKSSGASVAEVSCLLKDQKSEKRLCIVSMPAEHTTESSRHSANYIGRVLTNEIALLAKGPYTTVEVTNQNRRGRDEGCQVGVRMIPTSVDLSRLHVENLSVELNRPEHKERLKLAVGSFLCPANIQMKSELHDGSGVCIQGLKDTTEIALRTSTENRKEGLQEVAPGQEPSTAVQPKKKGLLTGLWHSISHSKADSAVISQSGTITPGKSATSVSSTLPSEEFHQGVSSTANDVYLYAAAVVQPTEEEEEGDELRALQEAIQSGTVETKFKIGALKFGKDTRPVSGAFDGIKELGVLRMVHSSSRERREHAMQVGVCMVPEEIMISSINLENVNLEVKSPEQAESLNLRAGSILYPAEMKLRTELREETSGITLATMTDIGSIQMNDGERLLNGTIEMRADGKQPDAINLRGSGGYRYDLQTQVGPITADVKIPAALVAEPPAVTPMPGLPLFGSTQTVSRMLKAEEMQAKRTTLTVNNQRPHSQLGVVEASLAQVSPSFKQQTTDIRLSEVKEMNLIMPSADNIRRAEEQVARPRVTTRDASHQVGAVLVPTQIKLEEMRLDASQLETETRRAISNLDLPQDTAFCATDMQLNTVLTESAGISLVNMKVVSDIGVQWSKGMCVADLVHSKNEPIQTCLRLRSGTVPSLAGVYQSVDQIRSEVLSVPSNGALTQVGSVTKKEALGQPGTSAHRRKQCDAVEFGAQVGLILVPTKIQMEHIGVDNLELSLARENGTNVQGVDNVRISKDIAVSAVLCCSDVEMTPVLTTAPGIQVANLRELDEIGIQVKDEICMAHINRSGLQNRMYIGNYAGRMQEKVSGQKTGGEVDIRTNTASIEKRNIGHDTVAETNTMKSNTFTYTQEGRISQRDEEFRKLYEAIKEGKAEVRLRVLNERTGATCLQTLNTQISNPSASQEKETQSVEGIIPRKKISTLDFSTQAGSMLIPAVVDMKRIDLQGAELTLKSASSVASHELNIPVASVICANTSELQSVLTTDSGLQIMSPAEAQSRNFQPHTKDVVTTAIGQWASTDRGTETAALRHLAQLSMQAPQSLKENMIITMPATAVLRGQNAIHAGMMASMNLQSGSTPSETDSLTNERIVALLRSSTSSKRLHITSGSVCHSDNLGGGRLVSQRSVKDLAEEINRGSQSAIDSFVSASGTRVASGGQQAPRSIQVIEQFPGTSITLRSAVSHPDTSTTLGTYISRSGTLMCEASMQVGTVLLPTKIHMNPTDTQILENTPPEAQTIVTEATNVSAGSLLVPSTVEMTSALAEVSGIHLVGVSDVSHVAVQMEGDMLFGEAEKNPSKEQGGGQFQTMIRMLHGLHTTDGSDSTMQPMTFQVTVDESRTRDTMQVSGSTKTATAAYSSQPRLATYTCACGRTYATSDFVPQPLLTSAEDRRVTASRLETVSSQSAAPMWPGSVTTAVSQFHVAADTLFSPSSSFVNKLSGKQNPVTVDNFMQCSEVDASDLQETIILMTCGMDVHTFPLSCMSPTQVIGQPNSSTSTRNPAVQSDASVQCAVLTRQDLLSLRFHPSTAVNTLSAISPGLVAGDLALLSPTNQIGQNAAPDEKREVGYYSKHAAADTQPVPMCTVCQQRNVSDCLQSMPGRDTREIPTQSIRQNISSQGRRMDLLSERAALTDQQDAATDIDPLKALTDQAAYVHDGQVERYIEALTNAEAQQLSTVVVAARKMMQKTFSTTGRLTGVSTYERLKEHNMVKLLVTEYDADRRSKMNWAQTQTEQMPNTIAGAGGETQRLEASLGGPSPPIKIVRSEKTKKSDVYSSSISSGSDEEEYLTQATVRPWPMRPRSKDYCDVACTAQIAPESLEKRIQVTEEAIQAASQPWMPNPPDSPTGR